MASEEPKKHELTDPGENGHALAPVAPALPSMLPDLSDGAAVTGEEVAALVESGFSFREDEERVRRRTVGAVQLAQRLSTVGLPVEFVGVLRHAGCDSAEDLEYLMEKDLMSMGIRRVFARRILLTANPPQPGVQPKPDHTAQALAGLAWRLMDAGDEPLRFLPPIEGLHQGPLPSVEEAVRPLDVLYPDACRYARHAHFAMCVVSQRRDVNGLEPHEAAALRLYLTDLSVNTSIFMLLNTALRNPDRSQLQPYFGLLRLILSALGKLPPMPKTTLFRGTRRRLEELNLPPPGHPFTWWGFSSTLESLDVFHEICGDQADRTIFAITATTGVRVREYSTSTSEDEIFLRPGCCLQVRSILRLAGNSAIVIVDEMPTPTTIFI